MRFYKHEESDTMLVEKDGAFYPFCLNVFKITYEAVKRGGLSDYGFGTREEVEEEFFPLNECEEVTQEYEMKAPDNHIGGGTKSIGSGSGDKTPSPDWDVKRPNNDGKNDFTGV